MGYGASDYIKERARYFGHIHNLSRLNDSQLWKYKPSWPFNCQFSDWTQMLDVHAAFAERMAAEHERRKAAGINEPLQADDYVLKTWGQPNRCGSVISSYNQAHMLWKKNDVKALFYVNDTITDVTAGVGCHKCWLSRWNASSHEPRKASAEERREGLERALRISRRSLDTARWLVASIPELAGVPIVQFRFNEDCSNHSRVVERASSAALLDVSTHGGIFALPGT